MFFNGTHAFLLKTILILANKNVTEPDQKEMVVDSFTEIPTNTLYRMEKGEGQLRFETIFVWFYFLLYKKYIFMSYHSI